MSKLIPIAALSIVLGVLFAQYPGRRITLAYIADIHAQIEPHPELFWHNGKEEIVTAGGAARIAHAITKLRDERPGEVLFMDAGDTFQGAAPAFWSSGAVMIPALNAMGLNLSIPGNWEVAYGSAAMKKNAAALHYPTIAANIFDEASGKRVFQPYQVSLINGVRIGIVGFTDPDVPRRQPPSYSVGLTFKKEEVLQPLIDELRSKVDVVVLLTHIGLARSIYLAETLKGVDVVLSGDSHERTYEPIVRGNTWIVEPGSFGSFLGRFDLVIEGGRIKNRDWQLIELRASTHPEDAKVKQIVEKSLRSYRSKTNAVIGKTEIPLMRYQIAEATVDMVLADALREIGGTDIALSNGFRFSAPIPAGPITEGDLWNVYPVVGFIKIGKVSGLQLREFWENEIEHVYSKDPRQLFGGWLPRPSGMTLRFNSSAPLGKRLRELLINGQAADDDKLYTITSCNREGDPLDTVCRIPNALEVRILDFDQHEAIRRYFKRHPLITAGDIIPGRVVAEDLPAGKRSQFLP